MHKPFLFIAALLLISSSCLAKPIVYEKGVSPSIVKQGNLIIEVHAGETYKTLWYKIGTIEGEQISWEKTHRYDIGTQPSIAVSGDTIVEVHQGDFSYKLWYHVGTINADSKTITWGRSHFFNKGYLPRVTLNGSNIIVSYLFNGVLVYKMGMISPESGLILWASS